MKNIIFISIILFIGLYIYYFYYNESFTVIPDKSIINTKNIDSLLVNNNIYDKYKNNYYYEYNNEEYETILKNIFNNKKNTDIKSYNDFLNYITNILNNSNELNNIQIVEDKQIDKNNIEVLLYRENKFEGKHVIFTIDNYWNIQSIKIVGSVSEDKIGLFPVLPVDPSVDNNLIIGNINDYIDSKIVNDKKIQNETIVNNNEDKNKILNISKNMFNNDSNILEDTKYNTIENEMNSKYAKFNYIF